MNTAAKGKALEDWGYMELRKRGLLVWQNPLGNKSGQIDLAFFYDGVYYLVECKVRENWNVSFYSHTPALIQHGRNVLSRLTLQLNKQEKRFKNSKFYNDGEVKKIVLLDGCLEIQGVGSRPFYDFRDFVIMRVPFFKTWLDRLDTHIFGFSVQPDLVAWQT